MPKWALKKWYLLCSFEWNRCRLLILSLRRVSDVKVKLAPHSSYSQWDLRMQRSRVGRDGDEGGSPVVPIMLLKFQYKGLPASFPPSLPLSLSAEQVTQSVSRPLSVFSSPSFFSLLCIYIYIYILWWCVINIGWCCVNKSGIWDAVNSRMFYYWTQCWRRSPAHPYRSFSVELWSQNSLTTQL